MSSTHTPSSEFSKDPEETDEEAFRAQVRQDLFGDIRSPLYQGSEPTLFQAIRESWKRNAPQDEYAVRNRQRFVKTIKDPKTWIFAALQLMIVKALGDRRNWGTAKRFVAYWTLNEAVTFVIDPAEYKASYRDTIGHFRATKDADAA